MSLRRVTQVVYIAGGTQVVYIPSQDPLVGAPPPASRVPPAHATVLHSVHTPLCAVLTLFWTSSRVLFLVLREERRRRSRAEERHPEEVYKPLLTVLIKTALFDQN